MSDLSSLTDSLVNTYVGYKEGTFLLFWDSATKNIAASILESAIHARNPHGGYISSFNIDDYRNGRSLTSLPADLKQELESKLQASSDPNQNTVLYIMHSLPDEIPMRKELIGIAQKHGKIGGLPECTLDVLKAAYHPNNNPAFSDELFVFIKKESAIRVTDDSGTDFTVTMNHSKYPVMHSSGILKPKRFGNPIPSEVYLYPEDVNGTMGIKGSYGPIMGHERFRNDYASLVDVLQKTPIIWQIRKGEITDVNCNDAEIQAYVRTAVFEKDPVNGNKFGEFGAPSNLYILSRELTGNMIIDEKGRVNLKALGAPSAI